VTGDEDAKEKGQSWGRVQFFVDHPLVSLLVRVTVPLLAFAVAVATFYLTQVRGDHQGDPSPQSTLNAPTSSTTPEAGPHTSPPAATVSVGSCLDAGNHVTACDAAHSTEVISTMDDCNMETLLRYLGGIPSQDFLLSSISPTTASLGSGNVCLATGPSGALTTRIADVLLVPAGDAWRRCVDTAEREVACSSPHKSEFILDHAPSGEDVNCAGRADAYLGSPFARHSNDLELDPLGDGCLISVRGRNVLTASLRRLGAQALPIRADG
jgi:hypothetical protein